MDAATVLIILLAAASPWAALYVLRRTRPPELAAPDPLERYLGTELVVNTHKPDDQAVRGVLLEVGERWLELTRATWLPTGPGAEEAPLDGHALVPRAHVSYVQALGTMPGTVLER